MATISKRRTQDGKIRYQAKVRLQGSLAQAATFERKRNALRWARETEAALRERWYFLRPEAARHTVGELIARYVREVLPTKRSAQPAGAAPLVAA